MKTIVKAPLNSRGHLPLVPSDTVAQEKVRFPDLADLLARLRFSTSDGRIWLDDQRMLLITAGATGDDENVKRFGHVFVP